METLSGAHTDELASSHYDDAFSLLEDRVDERFDEVGSKVRHTRVGFSFRSADLIAQQRH